MFGLYPTTKGNGNRTLMKLQNYAMVKRGSKGWPVMLVLENEKDKVKETKYQLIDKIYCCVVESENLFC